MSDMKSPEPPRTASVVVVGAGLSGLVAARDVMRAGFDDVVLVEAQDEVGGRIKAFVRDNGSKLERGAELTGPLQPTVLALAEEMGIEVKMMPMLADPENMGAFVRITAGERHVEPFPMADEPEALKVFGAAAGQFEELIKTVVAEEPWISANAAELDKQTVSAWLKENVDDPVARNVMEFELAAAGAPYEASLLFALAFFGRHGGMEGFATALPNRLADGTSAIVAKLADELGDRVVFSAPVRKITRDGDGVVVQTDRGPIQAKAVIVATEPNVISAIEFDPPLPADRSQLQGRWIASSGAKIFAVYDTPWWRDEGLNGFAAGGEFTALAVDFSPYDTDEGVLAMMVFVVGDAAKRTAELLQDPDETREAALADLELYFGPKARDVKEFHVFDWNGDRWSRGAGGAHLPPGVLTSYGHTLREPVGPILWAGEASGTGDYMEAAASAGKSAAKSAVDLLSS